ncbi:MAG: NADP-dependent oxidoreductase [Deltaproteobacteria bacterium]|nr:NADP-dependent oxidoreductase [Deltaproteobacteria bacterium]
MKAMLIRRYGGPEVFEAGEVETKAPGPHEALVTVRGSSVNPVDAGLRSGALKAFIRLRLPAVLGVDLAGEVAEVGAGVTRFKKGDRVFAYMGLERGGGYGELAVVPENYLGRVPSSLSWAEAGTVPGVGATAYEALTVHSTVKPGMRVFINGGAGGVGTYAIQIASALGAEVTATCSTQKTGLVRELGAAHVVDYTKEDPFSVGHDSYDIVLNCVRGPSLAPMRKLVKKGGALITVTGNPLESAEAKARNLLSSRRTVVFFVQTSGALLDGLGAMIESGKVRPVVERIYTWSELAEAHRRVETGRVVGKLAIVPNKGVES